MKLTSVEKGFTEKISQKLGDPVFQSRLSLIALLILNIYFLNTFINFSYLAKTSTTSTILFMLIILWFAGVLARKIYLTGLYYIMASGLLVFEGVAGFNIFIIAVFACIWLLVSNTIVDILLRRSYRRRHNLSLKGLVYSSVIILGIYSAYLFISYIVITAVVNIYSYIEASTPNIFRAFYEAFISTRIGSLIFFLLVIFTVYYVLDNFLTGLFSDTVFLNIDFVINRIRSIILVEARDLLRGNDPFQKIYVRTALFIIYFYVYGLVYPALSIIKKIIPITWLSYAVWIVILFTSSTMIYSFLSNRIKNTIVPRLDYSSPSLRTIRNSIRSRKWFYASLLYLFLYIGFIYVINRDPAVIADLLATSLSLKEPINGGIRDQATNIITRYYTGFCNSLINYIENYFYSIGESYKVLSKLLKELTVFLWG